MQVTDPLGYLSTCFNRLEVLYAQKEIGMKNGTCCTLSLPVSGKQAFSVSNWILILFTDIFVNHRTYV